MLFELVSGLTAVLCRACLRACLRANLLPLCLRHVCLLLACTGLDSMQLHPGCGLALPPLGVSVKEVRLPLAVSLCAELVCTDQEPLWYRRATCLLSQALAWRGPPVGGNDLRPAACLPVPESRHDRPSTSCLPACSSMASLQGLPDLSQLPQASTFAQSCTGCSPHTALHRLRPGAPCQNVF